MDGGASEIAEEGSVEDLGVDLEGWWNETTNAAVLWSFVLFGCFLLNAVLLLAFLIRPGLRTISNRFVMNLTASNLLTCAILNCLLMLDGLPSTASAPSSSTSTSSTVDGTTGSICAISEGATALVTTSSVLSVFLIAVDQYFAVVDPLRYRSRIDKLKSGILIFLVWFVSIAFGILASLNPNPRSLWLSCMPRSRVMNLTTENIEDSSESPAIDLTTTLPYLGRENMASTEAFIQNFVVSDRISYGFIYAVVHGLLAYLLPFIGVCWIYVRIYSAAHRNSERTRRTGSRPILSSGSFSYEDSPYPPIRIQHQQQCQLMNCSTDDFRRITKISSLSSIDETSETTVAPIGPQSNKLSSVHCSSSDLENSSSNVVFTVGSQRVDVSPSSLTKEGKKLREEEQEINGDKISVAALRAEFLINNRTERCYDDYVRSKFRHDPSLDQRRKSSHDISYERTLAKENNTTNSWIRQEEDSDSDNEDAPFPEIVLLKVPRMTVNSNNNIREQSLLGNALTVDELSTVEEDIEGAGEVEEGKESNENFNRFRGEKEEELRNQSFSSILGNIDLIKDHEKIDDPTCNRTGKDLESSTAGLLAPIVTITPASNRTLHRVSSTKSTSSYINSLKHRISNGSLFKYREETRAARISALVIVMGLICWSPYVLLVLLKNIPIYHIRNVPHQYDILALSFFILAAYVSPLLFGYRSKRVKRELRKFFCFRRELSYKNNKSLMAKKVLKRRHSSTPSHLEMDHKYNIFNCVYGRNRCPKEKVQFVQVPDTALGVETCRSSFSSGASTQISSTSTDEC